MKRSLVSLATSGVIIATGIGLLSGCGSNGATPAFEDAPPEVIGIALAIGGNLIISFALGHETTLAWTPTIEFHLDVARVKFKTGRAPVDHDSNAPSMGLAESSNTKLFTKGVTGHITESRGREASLTKRFLK